MQYILRLLWVHTILLMQYTIVYIVINLFGHFRKITFIVSLKAL